MVAYETWWDTHVAEGKTYTIEKFKKILSGTDRREFLKIVHPGDSVLDVGCGLGLDYAMYQKNNTKVRYVGMDICKGFIKYNQQQYPSATFMNGKSYDLPFEDKSFDIVTCRHLLEHLKEPYMTLMEFLRVGKSVAILWFIPPGEKEKRVLRSKGFYKNTYSRDSLSDFVKSLGFNLKIKEMLHSKKRKHELWYLTQ